MAELGLEWTDPQFQYVGVWSYLADALRAERDEMSEQEDRERAFDTCTWNASNEEREMLRDCVPVPREELERYKRALWEVLKLVGYPDGPYKTLDGSAGNLLVLKRAEFVDKEFAFTPAAHAFAAEMKSKETKVKNGVGDGLL